MSCFLNGLVITETCYASDYYLKTLSKGKQEALRRCNEDIRKNYPFDEVDDVFAIGKSTAVNIFPVMQIIESTHRNILFERFAHSEIRFIICLLLYHRAPHKDMDERLGSMIEHIVMTPNNDDYQKQNIPAMTPIDETLPTLSFPW